MVTLSSEPALICSEGQSSPIKGHVYLRGIIESEIGLQPPHTLLSFVFYDYAYSHQFERKELGAFPVHHCGIPSASLYIFSIMSLYSSEDNHIGPWNQDDCVVNFGLWK